MPAPMKLYSQKARMMTKLYWQNINAEELNPVIYFFKTVVFL